MVYRLHAVSLGKLSQWMSNFEQFNFVKTEPKPNFGFMHTFSKTEGRKGREKKE